MLARQFVTSIAVAGFAISSDALAAPDAAEMVKRLADSNAVVRRAAADELAEHAATAQSAVPALINALNDRDVRVRANSARALGKIKQPAERVVPALVEAFQDADWTVRHNAALALRWVGEAATPFLVEAVGDKRPRVRLFCADTLNRITPRYAAQTSPVLIALLDHPEDEIRLIAAEALGDLTSNASGAVPALTKLLDHPKTEARVIAIKTLGAIGQPANAAVPGLTALLAANQKTIVRVEAARALESIGVNHALWMPAVVQMLQPSHEEQLAAVAELVLGRIGTPAVPLLVEALKDAGPAVRASAAEALSIAGPSAIRAVPDLISMLNDADWSVRQRSVRALGEIGLSSDQVIRALNAASNDREEVVRVFAQEALRKLSARNQKG
jgi:HEAT repeat protein